MLTSNDLSFATRSGAVSMYALLSLLLISGCEGKRGSGSPDAGPGASHPDIPFVLIRRTPSYPIPGVESASGVIAAAWADGRVLRATEKDKPGASCVLGRASAHQIDGLIEMIEASDFAARARGDSPLVVDAAAVHMRFRSRAKVLDHAASVPVPGDSPLEKTIEYMYSIDLKDQKPFELSAIPDSWR